MFQQNISKIKIKSPEEAVKIVSKVCYRRSTTLKNHKSSSASNLIITMYLSTMNYSKFDDKRYTAKVCYFQKNYKHV